jgi:hypothetical protein
MKSKPSILVAIVQLAVLGIFLSIVLSLASWTMPHTLPKVSPGPPTVVQTGTGISSLGQPPAYFQQKWGEPVKVSKDASQMDWTQENMRTSITFKNNQAEQIRYTLSSPKWTNEQLTAALTANGGHWQMVLYTPTASDAATAFMASSGIARWRSDDGDEADIFGAVLTIKSAALLQAAAQAKAEDEQRRAAVPKF